MLAIIIPTYNAADALRENCPAARDIDLIVSDGGSGDDTLKTALSLGARLALGSGGRGQQLARGARLALSRKDVDWMLFVHADTQLPADWRARIDRHIARRSHAAGYFRFGADAPGFRARAMEFWVGVRCWWLGLPYGDQGLLISKDMYRAVGGYPEQTLFEDVEIIRAIKLRLGRHRLRCLGARAMTDVSAFIDQGIWRRGKRNLGIARGYILRGESLDDLARRYRGQE